jgi:hypothetical protein
MKILNNMQGKRVEDNTQQHLLKPGDYCKGVWDGKPTWYICTPNGLNGNLANHKCIEEIDGSLTVPSPKPGEPANSILCSGNDGYLEGRIGKDISWHGFMKNGMFKELG